MNDLIIPRSTLDVVITCDPAISEKVDAARTAITVAGMSPYNKIFLLHVWAARQGDPYKVIKEILALADKWQPRIIGIEAVAYQKALLPFMEREMRASGKWYVVEALKPDRNEKKNQRILAMQPFFKSGQIYVQRGMLDFIEEFESFPNGRTVDILDAFAYAVRLLVPQQPSKQPGIELRLAELAKKDPMSARYWRAEAVRRGTLDPQKTLDEEIEELLEEDYVAGIGELL
jgi:predicted phage terminase large subunit-like protein